jgi:phytoene dehydrogenase-like protein
VDEFAYPNGGTGYFYEKLSEKFKECGGSIFLNTKIEKIKYHNNEIILELNNEKKNMTI